MKTFFEDLGKRIGETAELVGNKANEAMEVQKLKGQIRTLERGNENDLEELGRMVYEKFRNGESLDEESAALCDAIQSREESIAGYNEQIADVRGNAKCGVCGKSVSREMAYCPYCGEKVPKSAPSEEDFVDEATGGAEDMAEKAADMTADAMKRASDMAKDAMNKASDVTGDAMNKASGMAEDAMNKASGVAEGVMERASGVIGDVKDAAYKAADTVAGKVKGAADTVSEKAEDVAETIKEKGKNN